MNELIQFFANISTELRTSLLVGGLVFFLSLESGLPLFRMRYKKFSHGIINITFTLITLVINLIGAIGIMAAVKYNEAHHSGMLKIIELPLWIHVLVGLALMDLIGAWLQSRYGGLEHKQLNSSLFLSAQQQDRADTTDVCSN